MGLSKRAVHSKSASDPSTQDEINAPIALSVFRDGYLIQRESVASSNCGSRELNLPVVCGARDATCLLCIHILQQNCSETESVEGRQFAMMAAQGLDVLWILCFLFLTFLTHFASGSENGMYSICF